MSLEYGKEIAERTLGILSNMDDPLSRVTKSCAEIDLIGTGDVNPEIFHQVKSWKERFQKANMPAKSSNGKDSSLHITLRSLIEDLVSICCEIIENNSILLSSKS